MTRIKNAYSAALLVALMASGIAAARVRPSEAKRQAILSSANATSKLDSQACYEDNVRRRRRADNMCSCRRRNSNSDLPSGYTCSGDNENGRDEVIKKPTSSYVKKPTKPKSQKPVAYDVNHVAVNASSKHGTMCDHCYNVRAELWEERSVCFLKCGESVYFPQSLGLYGTITRKYEKIGIYQLRLDAQEKWYKYGNYKYVARTNRHKVLIKFYDAEPDDYALCCPFADCKDDDSQTNCRDSRDEHSVGFKITKKYGYRRPKLEGFDVEWPSNPTNCGMAVM